jgi:tripartite-type tricarboxylate transporter receptor subunit TctC
VKRSRVLQVMLLSSAAFCGAAFTAGAAAQGGLAGDWPNRPVRLVVAFPPGGGSDVVARSLGEGFTRRSGQPVVVDNKGGASGAIGAAFVVKSAPDGYTFLLNQGGPGITAPLTQKDIQYSPTRDFSHVVLIGQTPLGVFTTPGSPYQSLEDMVRYARANPGKLDFGSPGIATAGHLVAAVLQKNTGVQFNHIPYKGSAANVQGLLGGQVPVTFDTLPSNIPLVKSGKLRALAVSTAQRAGSLPDVPTLREAGFPGAESSLWYGISGPAGMPRPIVNAMNAALNAYLSSPEGVKRLDDVGLLARRGSTVEEFTAFITEEFAKLQPIIRDNNITTQ